MGYEIYKKLKYIVKCVLEVVYPTKDKCIICDSFLTLDDIICKNCINKTEFFNNKFVLKKNNLEINCYCVGYYAGIIKELILRLKYKNDFQSGEVLGKLMTDLFLGLINNENKIDYITYVPSSKKSLKKRGYNQSEFLAKTIGDLIGVPTLDTLVKSSKTKDQIGLNGEKRWENLEHAFEIKENSLIKNKFFLLVDDVVTTGATAFYCSEKLIKYNAKGVCILTGAKSSI